jgi:hypothetical protein
MRSFHADIQAALDAGRVVRREFLRFEFGTGTYGFWSGIGPITYSGLVYQGAGSIIKISPLSGTTDGSSVPIQIRMSSIPNSELTPDVLAGIEDEDYNKRPVKLYRGFYDPANYTILDARWLRWSGTVDYIEHEIEPGGQAHLIFHCESRRLDDQRTGYRMRSDEDQRLIEANDRFFEHVATVGSRTIDWGRRPEKARGNRRERRAVNRKRR